MGVKVAVKCLEAGSIGIWWNACLKSKTEKMKFFPCRTKISSIQGKGKLQALVCEFGPLMSTTPLQGKVADFFGTAKACDNHSFLGSSHFSIKPASSHCFVMAIRACSFSPCCRKGFCLCGIAPSIRGIKACPLGPLTGGLGMTSSRRTTPSYSL